LQSADAAGSVCSPGADTGRVLYVKLISHLCWPQSYDAVQLHLEHDRRYSRHDNAAVYSGCLLQSDVCAAGGVTCPSVAMRAVVCGWKGGMMLTVYMRSHRK
jgi:hypothetical protein